MTSTTSIKQSMLLLFHHHRQSCSSGGTEDYAVAVQDEKNTTRRKLTSISAAPCENGGRSEWLTSCTLSLEERFRFHEHMVLVEKGLQLQVMDMRRRTASGDPQSHNVAICRRVDEANFFDVFISDGCKC